jgi:type VI secretion system protein ImpA
MPLREDILNPISESNPAGESLRYAPVYDKIKEARRQDDDAPQGEWQRERKLADYPVVIKLASESIATKSKDVQLAAWLTEALLAKEGFSGLYDGLSLIQSLVENFWEGLWPELDEGDAEMRAAPIDWVGQYLAIPAKRVPIAKGGLDFLKYLEAKGVGYEPQYEDSESRKENYQTAISEGKMPLEEFEKAVSGTPTEFYSGTVESIDNCFQVMEDSQSLFEEKFGEYSPSFGKLRESMEEIRRVVNQFLQKKLDADGPAPEPVVEEALDSPVEESWTADAEPAAVPVTRPKARRISAGAEPADKEDAALRVAAAAAFWRKEDPYSPAPYLMLRGMRWGELRASATVDSSLFEPPSGEVRTTLKRMLNEGSYAELIEVAETAMAEPCGRAWLDLQRYVVTACEYQGYTAVADAIRAELKVLVRDYPDLLTSTLADDTPTANRETLSWIEGFAGVEETLAAAPELNWSAPPAMEETPEEPDTTAEATPDSFQLAMDAMRGGRTEEAFSILADEIGHQNSGRGKFQRKLQLAQVCLSTGHENIALPLLEELQGAIDRHQLEEWEAPDVVAHALSLLFACAQKTDMDPGAKARLYARICRLSPVEALKHAGQAFAQGR